MSQPIWYFNATDCARALGVSRQRVKQLEADGKLPPHDAWCANDIHLWEAASFTEFAERRLEAVRNTPLGRTPELEGDADA